MDGVNGLDAVPPQKPLTSEVDDNGVPHHSTKVDYHLNILLASHLDLTPQQIADASRSTAAAAAIAAKVARALADEKAAAAAKAVAVAKSALDLIASFPNQALVQDETAMMKNYVAADLLYSKDEELPSKVQLGEDSHGIIPSSCPTCEHKNEQCKVHVCSRESTKADHAIFKRVDFDGLGMELGSDRLNESAGGERAKSEGIQVTRKRGRKSK